MLCLNSKLMLCFQVRTAQGPACACLQVEFATGLVLCFKISQALLAVDQIQRRFVVASTVLANVRRIRCLDTGGNRADSAVIRVPQREAHPKHVSQPAVQCRCSALATPNDIFISNSFVIRHVRIQNEVVTAFAAIHLAPARANVCRRSFLSRCDVR